MCGLLFYLFKNFVYNPSVPAPSTHGTHRKRKTCCRGSHQGRKNPIVDKSHRVSHVFRRAVCRSAPRSLCACLPTTSRSYQGTVQRLNPFLHLNRPELWGGFLFAWIKYKPTCYNYFTNSKVHL